MSSNRSKAGQSSSTSSAARQASIVDVSQHPGFVNLGNTCFLNSALQALSATKSLKQLYEPTEEEIQQQQEYYLSKLTPKNDSLSLPGTPGPSSRRASTVADLIDARCKSPVLRLADEEHGRHWGPEISRPGSTSIEASSISALASQAVSNPTPADIQTIQNLGRRGSLDGNKQSFEPRSSDLPLNTAFRQVIEKSWDYKKGKSNASSGSTKSYKAPSINPKPLLNEISSKYDQYSEYKQQDGHELLRHLLDSLRMEELDVIKKIQPPKQLGKRRRNVRSSSIIEKRDELKPLVDNLFCGKLLSFVLCEGCRHVSHTYEDFYDVSLSLRPDVDTKDSGKRQRIRSMANRWRKTASSKADGNMTNEETSKFIADTLTRASYSDAEQSDDPVKRSSSRLGRSISRPRSSADRARIDANSKEGSKTFIKKQVQQSSQLPQSTEQNGSEITAMEKLSLEPISEKRRESISLLRAVSGRRTPSSRAASPLRKDFGSRASSPGIDNQEESVINGGGELKSHRHHLHLAGGGHHKTKTPSKHAQYISKLLTEAPPQPQQANIAALFWGRSRTPASNESTFDISKSKKNTNGIADDFIAQQANTGLVKALYQFTNVEVLDGNNMFECKRCWRMQNPPSAEEDERLRLRRLRRGKKEDDSETSSDCESSSDEEAKEEKQKAALIKSDVKSNLSKSSVSSFASISDGPITDSSLDGTVDAQLSQEEEDNIEIHSMDKSTPSLIVSSDTQNGSQTPTGSTIFSMKQMQSNSMSNLKKDESQRTLINQPIVPKLQAPKPVVASAAGLRLGTESSGTSSDEGGASQLPSSNESSEDENENKSSNSLNLKKSIRYADEGISTITKPASIVTSQTSIRKRRTAQSIRQRALKRFLIAETPKVFVFHFKRFQATGRGFSFSTSFKKIDDYISFPEYLDVKPWLAPPREEYNRRGKLKASSDPRALLKAQKELQEKIGEDQKHHHHWGWKPHLRNHVNENNQNSQNDLFDEPKTKYRLYAVVVHQGSMSGGHYTAYVLSDRASESLKAKANANAHIVENGSGNTNGKEKTKSETSLSNTSTNGKEEENSNDVSIVSPLTPGTSVDPLSSVSSLGLGDQQQEKETEIIDSKVNNISTPPINKIDERRWIYASDTLVKPATIEEVLKAQAYMLFYEQI